MKRVVNGIMFGQSVKGQASEQNEKLKSSMELLIMVVVWMYIDRMRKEKVKSRQHPDFPGGHPPEYYPSLRLLNFTERTGYGVLSLRWPSTSITPFTNHPFLSKQITNDAFHIHYSHIHHTLYSSNANSSCIDCQHQNEKSGQWHNVWSVGQGTSFRAKWEVEK